MSKIVVFTNLTLDGVMQAPGRPDADRRGGFEHGGWAVPFAAMRDAGATFATAPALLFGRRTYESFYSFWPKQTHGNPFTEVLNNAQKYVASTTLQEPLPWSNSLLLKGDAADALAQLKQQIDADLLIIHPLILGTGRRLFAEGSPTTALRLIDSKTTSTGVVIATYQPDEPAGKAA